MARENNHPRGTMPNERRSALSSLSPYIRSLCALTLLAGAGMNSGGCASVAAMQEDTSLELALVRTKAIESNDLWAERLMTQTKVGAEDWPGELHTLNDQHIMLRNQLKRRGPHNPVAAERGLVDERDYVITPAEIFRQFVWSKLDKIGVGTGPYASVLAAFASLYGDKGEPVLAGWRAVDEALLNLEMVQDTLARAQTERTIEEQLDPPSDERLAQLEAKISEKKTSLDTLEEELEAAEDALIELLEELEDIEIGEARHPLAADLLEALNFIHALYAANTDAAIRVQVQTPRSMSGVMEELHNAGVRIISELAPDQAAETLKGLKLSVAITEEGDIELSLEGAPAGMESEDIAATLTKRLDDILKRGFSLPAFIGSLGTTSETRERILEAMYDALEESTGLEGRELEDVD